MEKKDKLIDKVNKINEGLNGQLYGLEKSMKELEDKINHK
jgi:chaperonin cofactor prefoldin